MNKNEKFLLLWNKKNRKALINYFSLCKNSDFYHLLFFPTDFCFIIQPACTKEVQTDPHLPYLVDFPLERASGNKHINFWDCTSVIYKFIFSVKTKLVPKPGKTWNKKQIFLIYFQCMPPL